MNSIETGMLWAPWVLCVGMGLGVWGIVGLAVGQAGGLRSIRRVRVWLPFGFCLVVSGGSVLLVFAPLGGAAAWGLLGGTAGVGGGGCFVLRLEGAVGPEKHAAGAGGGGGAGSGESVARALCSRGDVSVRDTFRVEALARGVRNRP